MLRWVKGDVRGWWLMPCMLMGSGPAAAQGESVMPEVEVRASATDSREMRRNSTAGKIIVTREELEALDAASVAELLSRLPGAGMFADMDSGGRGRGPSRNMPQILVDGQSMPGGGRNPAAALRLPVELIERVEIIRNSTPEFPVLGPGGVVNLVLRDVPSKSVRSAKLGLGSTDGEPSLRVEGQYGEPDGGDFGYMLSGAFSSRPNVGTSERESTSYTAGVPSGFLNESTRSRGRDNNLTLSPRFSWKLAEGERLTLSPFLTATENSRDSFVRRNQSGVSSSEANTDDSQRLSGRLSTEWKRNRPGGTETTARLMLQGERDEQERQTWRYDGSGALTSNSTETTTRREQEWMLDLRHKQAVFGDHLLTGAVEVRDSSSNDEQRRSGSVSSFNRADLTERRWVGWLQDEWQLSEKHVLTPGLRWQVLNTRIDDTQAGVTERSQRSLDPSLHYLWQLSPQWNLRASVARNMKAPQTRDLSPFARATTGINSSSNPDRGGNSALNAEKLRSIELGIEHFLPNRAGTIGLSVFKRDIDGYIQRLTQLDSASGRWVERPFNVGSAELNGVVFDYKTTMGALGLPQLTLRGNAAYTDVTLRDRVAGLGAGEGPRKSANLGMDYEIKDWRLTLGGNFNYVSALDRESSATVRQMQGARRQLDLYALHKLDRQLSLRFSAQNVTRETRRNFLEESDASGSLVRSERDWVPGLATYMVTLEARF